jgi:hypothetical protein
MGCGKATTLDRTGGALTVYGDYFNTDTRTILAILDIAGATYSF